MKKIHNKKDLLLLEAQMTQHHYKKQVLICGGTGCLSAESGVLTTKIKDLLKEKGLENDIQVTLTGCFGFCEKGPILKILPDNTFYVSVHPQDAQEIVENHLIAGKQVDRLLYRDPTTGKVAHNDGEMDFYRKQKRVALRNCGFINPESIHEYIARKGYQALAQILEEKSPQEVIQEVKTSGLRGRGGGGFPTGLKWEMSAKSQSDIKYVVCNADEGDPGAFMDRSILEGDPHSILEAMAICGYATGANHGLIYIRAEYPLAIKRLNIAIESARALGLLGNKILYSNFSFDVEIKLGAGAFVCGEETALIHSMEGERGEPTRKPPFPSEKGYWGKPTTVNNVETLANIPSIFLQGAQVFSKLGTEKSKGTKVFALAGKINNVGLIEVPMGISLREVIYDVGGGITNNKKFKAVQTGGPSGGCLATKHLDTHIDFDTLIEKGSMMGSGGMIVMDENDCMVAMAKFYLEFTVEESCGRCTPCRVGTKRLYEMLEKITQGKGTLDDLKKLKTLSQIIKDTSLCGLGQTAPNPILSTLENFYDEYLAHVKDKSCPAGQCSALLKYTIIDEKCVGCTACARVCPVNCISGKVKEVHKIDQDTCIKCGACFSVCRFNAVRKNA